MLKFLTLPPMAYGHFTHNHFICAPAASASLRGVTMALTGTEEITKLLKAWAGGDAAAQECLIPLVYKELRYIARHYRNKSGAGETLRTTALVHEAYMRLVGIRGVDWHDRVHFFAISAQLMRRILVDSARARGAMKRGGDAAWVADFNPDDVPAPESVRAMELIELDDALTNLSQLDPRRARVIELRVFGGLTIEELAEVLGLSSQSVRRDWKLAKAWLLREMSRNSGIKGGRDSAHRVGS